MNAFGLCFAENHVLDHGAVFGDEHGSRFIGLGLTFACIGCVGA
jgi:hypothetical protein